MLIFLVIFSRSFSPSDKRLLLMYYSLALTYYFFLASHTKIYHRTFYVRVSRAQVIYLLRWKIFYSFFFEKDPKRAYKSLDMDIIYSFDTFYRHPTRDYEKFPLESQNKSAQGKEIKEIQTAQQSFINFVFRDNFPTKKNKKNPLSTGK